MIIMGKIKRLELTAEQYAELENGFRNGTSHCFRMRCRAVLLKGKGLSSAKVGEQTEMSFVSANAWVKRFVYCTISTNCRTILTMLYYRHD